MKIIIIIILCFLLMGCQYEGNQLQESDTVTASIYNPLESEKWDFECIEWVNKTHLEYRAEIIDWTCCEDLCTDQYFICYDACEDGTADKRYCGRICRDFEAACSEKCYDLKEANFQSLARNEPEFAKWIKDENCTRKEEFKNETETHCVKEMIVFPKEVQE